MQAEKRNLGQIFQDSQQNVIPLFQRPYVWDQEKNWEPLWDDIRMATEDSEDEVGTVNTYQHSRTYFLGALVIQQRLVSPAQVRSWSIIDGQQRLTTLQILLAAARSVAAGHKATNVAAKFDSLIFNNKVIVDSKYPNDAYKVWPLPHDRGPFLWAVDLDADSKPCPDGSHRISKARAWFKDQIFTWANLSSDPVTRLNFLHQTFQERMELVLIQLDQRDDPQVIFEVLNHRGVPLSASDLIKNLMVQKLDQEHHANGSMDAAEKQMEVWSPLDQAGWKREITTGRLKRQRIDLLLTYWLTIQTGKEIQVDHLFGDFKNWMSGSTMTASEIIADIRNAADTMDSMVGTPLSNPLAHLLDRMETTQTTTPWPLLLYLYSNSEVPDAQRRLAVQTVDSYLMRRNICRLPRGDYNRLFLQMLTDVRLAPLDQAGDSLVHGLLQQSAPSRVWPTNEQFTESLRYSNVYWGVVRARLKALLVGMENHLHDGNVEIGPLRTSDKDLNIEHVLPQDWGKNWPLPKNYTPEQLQDRHNSVHALGNLTLTTMKFNSTLSNRPWKSKRKLLSQYSLLRLTTGSVLSNSDLEMDHDDAGLVEHWEEGRIHQRGSWLASVAIQAFSRPSVPIPASERDAPDASS